MKSWKTMVMAVVAIGVSLAVGTSSQAAWNLVDNFEGETLGVINGQMAPNGETWYTQPLPTTAPTQNYMLVDSVDSSQVYSVATNAPKYALGTLDFATPIAEGTSATLYCRVKLANTTGSAATTYSVGANDGDNTGNASKTTAFGFINDNDGTGRAFVYTGLSAGGHIDIQLGEWYDVWMYINMTGPTMADYYYEEYISGPGLTGQVQMNYNGDTSLYFRNYDVAGLGLNCFGVYKGSISELQTSTGFYVDDVYIDHSGKNLVVPEPASLILLGLGALALRRRK